MAVTFKQRWRDTADKDEKGYGKLYMPFETANFSKKVEDSLVQDGTAKKVVNKTAIEDKNGAPKGIEKKTSKKKK